MRIQTVGSGTLDELRWKAIAKKTQAGYDDASKVDDQKKVGETLRCRLTVACKEADISGLLALRTALLTIIWVQPYFLKGNQTMTTTTPVRASDTPFAVQVEQGKDYYWCACGQSKSQPFCDGSHKNGPFTPVKYSASENKEVYFCGCKATANQPLCDGSHKKPV